MKFTIKHDTKSQKFYTLIGGKECSLKYEKISDNVYNLKMMFVPKNLRGQGIASRIMEFTLTYAKKNTIKVKASCSYVEKYLDNHREYAEVVYSREELVA
jgi:hypothetical protein